MEDLDISTMKRNSKFMDKYTIQKGNNVIAKEELYFLFPDKFIDKNLSVIDMTSTLLACMAICKDNEYAVMNMPCKIKVSPSSVEDVVIDGVVYKKLIIDKNDLVMDTTKYVKNGNMVYDVFEYMVIQGKVPWYMEYEDLFGLFNNVPEYTGTSVGEDPLVFEIVTAVISRYGKDIHTSYRNVIKKREDLKTKELKYIGLMNMYYTFKSTLAKISGSYFKEGIISAVVNGPTDKATDLEKIIRD